jgi:Predicted DNA-binding protein with PD1-like DNA-binding motif
MNAQTLKGNHWTAKSVEGAYIVSIEDRASILGALTDFITSQKIQAGQITGIGATNEATLRFFDPSSKKYVDKTFNEQMEISNLSWKHFRGRRQVVVTSCILHSAGTTTLH